MKGLRAEFADGLVWRGHEFVSGGVGRGGFRGGFGLLPFQSGEHGFVERAEDWLGSLVHRDIRLGMFAA